MRKRWMQAAGLLVLALLSSCSTLAFRAVQDDFEAAIRGEGDGVAGALSGRYAVLASTLSDSYISGLDARLQANAYMMRAISEWRARMPTATATAEAGLQRVLEGDKGRRDEIVLKMIRSLVIETEVMDGWVASGQTSTATQIEARTKDLTTAMAKLDEAGAAMQGRTTASSTRDYYHYQRWRIFRNWGQLIATIDAGDATIDEKQKHYGRLLNLRWFRALGNDGNRSEPIKSLAQREAGLIRDGSPLRKLTE